MSKIVLRHSLREKEAKKLLLDFSHKLSLEPKKVFGIKPRVEMAEALGIEVIIVDGKPLLAKFHDLLLPTLVFDAIQAFFPKIVVNMGAVPYVCNGADVMAAGVVRIDGDFKKDDFLLILDERHGKSLGIGIALFDSQTMKGLKQGKIVKNIHCVGDKLWNFIKRLA